MHEKGTYNYISQSKYEREFIQNCKNGKGVNTSKNGDKYVGESSKK